MRECVWVATLLVLGACRGAPADGEAAGARDPRAVDSAGVDATSTRSVAPAMTRLVLAAPPSADERQRICAGLHNSYRCAQAIERWQLARTGAAVRRDRRVLSLALASGESLRIADDSLAEWPSSYSYLGYVRDLDYYVLHAQHPEGNTVVVIHRGSGWRGVLDAVPQAAPGGARVATASRGPYNDNEVSIYRVSEDTLELEWMLEPDDWAPQGVLWTDTLSLHVIRGYAVVCEREHDIPRYEIFQDTASVWRDASGWARALPPVASNVDSMRAQNPGSRCRQAYPG